MKIIKTLKNFFYKIIIIVFLIIPYIIYSKNILKNSTNFKNNTILFNDCIGINNEKFIIRYNAKIENHNLIKFQSFFIKNVFINFLDIKIQNDYTSIDWKNNSIYNNKVFISSNKLNKTTVFIQKNKKYEYKKFFLNFKTQESIAENIRFEEQKGVLIAKNLKKKKILN